MDEYLYVCLFSNKHIKIGRSFKPKYRISSHAERVSCLGINLDKHHIVKCAGNALPAEFALINRCAGSAGKVNHREWFEGLNFKDVTKWADEFAAIQFLGWPKKQAKVSRSSGPKRSATQASA